MKKVYGGQPSCSGGMQAFGVGYTPLKKLCCYLNMPEPMSSNNYDNMSKTVKDVTKVVAEKSMADAAKQVFFLFFLKNFYAFILRYETSQRG